VVWVGKSTRRLRFFLLEKLGLRLAILPVRAWVWSWRKRGPSREVLDEIAAAPRVIFAVWHSGILQAFAFHALNRPYRRRWCVLATPSLDGRLAAALLGRFGAGVAMLASGVRGLDAAGDFVRRVQAGDWGITVADGPRGPREMVKRGVVRTANAADARVVAVGLAAGRGIRFRSWDRTHLPLPFARVAISCRLLPPPLPGQGYSTEAIQAGLEAATGDAVRLLAGRRTRGPESTEPMAP
jgi:lysophospholipid acyltransferase (LPLAT)-like uncharacterized protein